MTIATSAVQSWTLGIASVAAVAGIAGVVFTAVFAKRSEHETWQRDVRLRLYSACSEAGERYSQEFSHYLTSRGNEAKADVVASGGRIGELDNELRLRVEEVRCFGSDSVASAAHDVGLSYDALLVANTTPPWDKERVRVALNAADQSVDDFRKAVRASMKITKE
jgi:hypothetical protein